jgi:RNA ligase (TIGR02306 family)
MSTHKCPVFTIKELLPHPNADALEIVKVGGWQCCVRKGDYKVGDLAVYIEPDFMVPTDKPEFAFLAREGETHARIKAKKLRGQMSYGLIVRAPAADNGCTFIFQEGADDVAIPYWGIQRYEPPISSFADAISNEDMPKVSTPKFDVESRANYPNTIKDGEEVIVTEKIHGANARFMFHDRLMYCGSRTRWLKHDGLNMWSQAIKLCPGIENLCRAHPDVILYGELYGNVQNLKYGVKTVEFAAFAMYESLSGQYANHEVLEDLCNQYKVPMAPVIYRGKMCNEVYGLAETDSQVSKVPQLMEGIVIKPVVERWDENIGRVVLKHISNRYWAKE